MADFIDVPEGDIFHADVEKVFRKQNYGWAAARATTAAKVRCGAIRWPSFFSRPSSAFGSWAPPSCAPPGRFLDAACPGPFTDWVEQLEAEGITGGCGEDVYCPSDSVRRDQMAVFLLKAEHGQDYVPPPCTGFFYDVPCPFQYADWIEQLVAEGITAGCRLPVLLPGGTRSPAGRWQCSSSKRSACTENQRCTSEYLA